MTLQTERSRTLEEVRAFVEGSERVDIELADRASAYEFFHDYVRPHMALDCRTPNEYLVQIEEHACPDSQSSERS